jgi:DNA-binding GntR family transcriptional regulator
MPTRSRAPNAPYEPISLAEHAYLEIRDQILKCELPLGTPLSRRKLAAALEMSLVPVAEALQRLEAEGLVESRPRIGTRVCQPSAEDIRGRYEVREALEAQVARLFAEKASARERTELCAMADTMDAMYERCFHDRAGDREYLYEVHSFHADLHMRLAQCTGCRALCRTIERNHVMMFNWLYDVAAKRPPLPPTFHRDLIDVLCEGGVEKADQAMREHVRYGLENVLAQINLDPAGLPSPRGRR